MHPSSGRPEVSRLRWLEEGGARSSLSEEALSELDSAAQGSTEVWHLVEPATSEPDAAASTAVLELVDCQMGRRGVWIVIGSWFARVVGRRADDVLSDVACRSFMHAVQNYIEGWGMDIPTAVHGCEAEVGRVEAPGVLRVLHGFSADADGPCGGPDGPLLLDGSARLLRRDADDGGLLVESHSSLRWRIRELSPSFTGFGQLKRAASAQ